MTHPHPIYLRQLRERRGLTQVKLARKSRVAQNTISKLETQRGKSPEFATVIALATALDCDPLCLRFGPAPRVRVPQKARAPQKVSKRQERTA